MFDLWTTIDRMRRERALTLRKLGEIAGVSPQAVQKWKNGGAISFEKLQAISVAFGTTVDALMAGDCKKPVDKVVSIRETAIDAYPTPSTASPPICRFPADCDLSLRLERMEAQLQTLTQLLGASLRVSQPNEAPIADPQQKTG